MDNLTLVASLAFLAATSVVTHMTGQAWLGFALAPVPLLLYRQDGFRIMLLSLAACILFYEDSQGTSNFLFFNTPDSMLIVYIAMAAFFSPGFGSFTLPVSPGLIPLYAFIGYGLALSVMPVLQMGFDFYVMRDIKCLLFLALVPLLCRKDEPLFDPKNIFRMLVAIVLLTTMHSMVLLSGFLGSGYRALSWNEIYLADAILMIPILLSMKPGILLRRVLYACLPICLVGLLATQTRGLWLSALISFCAYAGIRLIKSKSLDMASLMKSAQAVLGLLVLAEILLRFSAGVGVAQFVQNRLTAHAENELVNPFSSLGYRIHESLVVWDKRTWFGHGSGARLYLFFTQMGMSKFINWWSIHSEYFEILHKYGFIGLGIFLTFILSLLRRAYRMATRGKAFPSALGYLVFTTLLNHCLVSITSGYLIRENVMLFIVLLVGIVERYHPRVFPSVAPERDPEPAETADAVR